MKISNKIKMFAASALVSVAGVGALVSGSAFAVTCDEANGWVPDPTGRTCVLEDESETSLWGIVNAVINWILAIVGVIAVFMIILGGIQYSTSAGDSGKVKKAKDTILYGIIGLVIALLAAAIVNFVLDGIFSSDGEGEKSASIVTTYVA